MVKNDCPLDSFGNLYLEVENPPSIIDGLLKLLVWTLKLVSQIVMMMKYVQHRPTGGNLLNDGFCDQAGTSDVNQGHRRIRYFQGSLSTNPEVPGPYMMHHWSTIVQENPVYTPFMYTNGPP